MHGSPVSILEGIQSLRGSPDVQMGADGTLLYVEGTELGWRLSATDSATGEANLFVVGLATRLVTRLTFEGDSAREYWSKDTSHYYAVTSDGRRFFMVRSVISASSPGEDPCSPSPGSER